MRILKHSGRRAAAWLLTAALTVMPVMPSLAASSPDVSPDWSSSFPDVEEDRWYYPYVEALTRLGLIRGYDNGNFGPQDEIRAGDSIILVVRTAGGGDPEPPEGTHYAQGYVDTAIARGWVDPEEIPDELNGPATRLFIARMAAKGLGIEPAMRDAEAGITEPSPFSDVDDGYVTALYQEGLVEGTFEGGGRIFMPDTPISRSELSAIVWRMVDWQRNRPLTPDSQEGPAKPEDPVGPENPGEAEDPAGSENLGEMEDPGLIQKPGGTQEPENPDNGMDPSDPTDPNEPADPNDPQTPGDPSDPDDPVDPGEEEPPTQFPFRDKMIDIAPGVPVSPYDQETFSLKNGRVTCSAEDVEVTLGIDVATYQGDINWKQVAGDGVKFAIIRVGGRYYGLNSGTIYSDNRFDANLEGAMDAGLETGVYFFSQAISEKEAVAEASFVLEQLKRHPDFHGPVVFDWENIGNDRARTDNMKAADVTAAALAFCRTVEKAGYSPMIYFNRYIAYELYELDKVVQYPFWIADYNAQPQFYYDFAIWQYSDRGTVKGIKGAVDMNVRLTLKK